MEVIGATDRHEPIRQAARRFVETERVWPVSAANYKPVYERLITNRAPRS